jgi:hypothetical protein
MSFPPGTEMFQFPGFASLSLCIQQSDILPIKPRSRSQSEDWARSRFNSEDGFPHSEICGSKVAHTSPQLIAACHVLHRLCMPRHPPVALTSRLRIHTTIDRPAALNSLRLHGGLVCRSGAASAAARISQLDNHCCNCRSNCFDRQPRHRFLEPIHNVKEEPLQAPAAASLPRIWLLHLETMVEPVGIEPTTSSLQS